MYWPCSRGRAVTPEHAVTSTRTNVATKHQVVRLSDTTLLTDSIPNSGSAAVEATARPHQSPPTCRMTVMAEWREQWERVLRMLARVQTVYDGRTEGGTADAKDDVYSFFQNVHHLRDWLWNDTTSGLKKRQINAVIKRSTKLRICGDLCNGSKHSKLDQQPWTGDPGTAITKNDVNIEAPTARAFALGGGEQPVMPPPTPGVVRHKFYVQSGGNEYDALDLAKDAVSTWRAFLVSRGVL